MNPVLAEIHRTGAVQMSDGTRAPVHSGVNAQSGELLRRAVLAAAPRTACEVGLAFGISTLHILDAMGESGSGTLIGMDPAQHDATWQGTGLSNVRRAGLTDRFVFHEASSQVVLPRLAESGTRIQFAFIDGWHTFDHTLVDFFYIDQMMDPGGIVVLDDVVLPGLRRLAEFIVTNRDYTLVDRVAGPPPATGLRPWLKRQTQRLARPLVRDHFSPRPTTLALERPIADSQMVALRKKGNDARRFDHFEPF
jgi:predicted O-methyltransferase YrrM